MSWDEREALEVARRIVHEGDYTPDDFDLNQIDDTMEALDALQRAGTQVQAAKTVEAMAKQRVAELLGEGGAARLGETIFRYQVGRSEHCFDPDGAAAYLTTKIRDGELSVDKIVNPQYAKRSALSQAERDTFYEWVDDDAPSLKAVPVDRAPKFLQTLNDGEVTT